MKNNRNLNALSIRARANADAWVKLEKRIEALEAKLKGKV